MISGSDTSFKKLNTVNRGGHPVWPKDLVDMFHERL